MFSLFRLQIATTWTKSSQRPSPTTMTATSVLSPSSFDCRDGSGTGNGDDGGWSMRPMDAEQLRECGHRMVDFIADYYKSIETFSVLSQVQARSLLTLLQILQYELAIFFKLVFLTWEFAQMLLLQHYLLVNMTCSPIDPATSLIHSINNSLVLRSPIYIYNLN
uniref:Uncharacterized protein n=1 Tax=Aegilops tauschii subsp. strangulata TaxID=200361 RepID=A0A453G8X3_AEGTS